jgi:UDP-N-acetyl-D-mannosaminuronate dehydrogenase
LGEWVVHSPIHGKHPDLSGGIKTFAKYVGGSNPEAVYKAVEFLSKAGIKPKIVSSPEASELSKILCTSYYGWNIVFMKEVQKLCKHYNVDFYDVYTRWNSEYNKGYKALGMEQFTRPVLDPMPGKIGGHCVMANAHLVDSLITKTIIEQNKKYE